MQFIYIKNITNITSEETMTTNENKPKLYMLIEIVCDDEMDYVKTEEEWLREFEESEEFEDWMEGKTAKELFDEFRRNEMLIEVERDDFDQWVKVEDAP